MKLKKMCAKSLNKYFFAFIYTPDWYKTQETCKSVISEDPFSIRYVPDQYKTQRMCDKAADYWLAALKFLLEWFATSKMIKIFLLLCMQTEIWSSLIKILVMPYLIKMERVSLI